MNTKTRTNVHIPDDVLEALYVRQQCQASQLMTSEEATALHLDQEWEAAVSLGATGLTPAERGRAAVARARALLARGQEYHRQGYRLHMTARQAFGVGHDVPDAALQWSLVTAGHIATGEQWRLLYVTRLDGATPAEAAAVLGVSARRVQRLIQVGRLPAERVGRDYLIRRADLEAFAASPRPAGRPKSP